MKIIEIKPTKKFRRGLVRRGSARGVAMLSGTDQQTVCARLRAKQPVRRERQARSAFFDEAGENVVEVIPVQGHRAFGA